MVHIDKIDSLILTFVNDLHKHLVILATTQKVLDINLKHILSPWILSLMTAIVPI